MQKFAIFVNENFEDKYGKDIKDHKVRYLCYYRGEHRGVAHSLCNLNYNIPKKIPIVFQDGSNYDYHFIIKVKTFYLFRKNTEKYITFSVPIQKEVTKKIDKNGEASTKTKYTQNYSQI